jgi:hypothetical protein
MSDGKHYKDIIVKAKFSEDEDGQVIIKTPFQRYSEHVWVDGVDVTYSYRTMKELIGKDCVVFTSCIVKHDVLPSEEVKAFSDVNTLGATKEAVKTNPIFTKHFVEAVAIEEEIIK